MTPTSTGATPKASRPFIEWQTALLAMGVHAVWLLGVVMFEVAGAALGCVWLAVAACWHMSLQHELIHGHPTRSRAVNRFIGLAPLSVWFPYDLYRTGHLAHHRNELLTHPGIDPESNYIHAEDYERLPFWSRPFWVAQRTVLGRLLIGPAFVIVPAWLDIVRKPLRGDFSETRAWALHVALVAMLLAGLERIAGIDALVYLLGVAYPALGLAMLRSFHEHRPADVPAHRVVVNEAGLFWRLLFLNNNYHSVHHEDPSLPWYQIRRAWLAGREGYLARNGGFFVRGYGTLVRRHALVPVDSPMYPAAGVSSAQRPTIDATAATATATASARPIRHAARAEAASA